MNSFTCVIVGAVLLASVQALPFSQDAASRNGSQGIKFNQTEINQMIHDLTRIQPVLGNNFQELVDYITLPWVLHDLKGMNETKRIGREFLGHKELINRNRHYLSVIVTNRTQLAEERKAEAEVSNVLVELNDLLPKLVQKNRTDGIRDIGQHIDVETRLLSILHRNLTYNASQLEDIVETSNEAIKYYSQKIKLD